MVHVAFLTFLFCYQDSPVIEERLQVEYVLLDVAAFDRKDNLVTDLTAADFEVKDGRKPVEITFFDVLDYRNPRDMDLSKLPESHRQLAAQSETQQIILAVDLDSATHVEAVKGVESLRRFVETLDPKINFRVNLYSLDLGTLTHGFTSDRRLLDHALTQLEDRYVRKTRESAQASGDMWLTDSDTGGGSLSSNRQPAREDQNRQLEQLERAFLDCKDLNPTSTSDYNRCLYNVLQDFVSIQRDRSDRVAGQLEILADAFDEVGGLKSIYFLSPGFSLEGMSSASYLYDAYRSGKDDFLNTPNIDLDLRDQFRRVIHLCTRNRVVFHTFDIFNSSLGNNRQVSAAHEGGSRAIVRAYRYYQRDVTSGLKDLAEFSGGSFYPVFRLDGALSKALEKNRFYYLIGYAAPEGGREGRFRKIKVKCKRKKVDLHYRSGYHK